MKCTTCASAIASKSRDAQVYCQFHTGEISAQPPCSTALIRSWSSPIRAGGWLPPKARQRASTSCALKAVTSISEHPAVEHRRRVEAEAPERVGPAAGRAPLDVVAHGGQRMRPDVDLEQRGEVAALHEDVGVEVEQPPVGAGEGRRQRQPQVGRLGAPRILPEPGEGAAGVDPGEADAEVVQARDRRGVRRRAEADVEAPLRRERDDLRGGEGGEAQVVAVGGEDDRGVGALLALAGQADCHAVLPQALRSPLRAPAQRCRAAVVTRRQACYGTRDPSISGARADEG